MLTLPTQLYQDKQYYTIPKDIDGIKCLVS